MDTIISLASLIIFLLLYLIIYNKLSNISKALEPQKRYYESLEQAAKKDADDKKFQSNFNKGGDNMS